MPLPAPVTMTTFPATDLLSNDSSDISVPLLGESSVRHYETCSIRSGVELHQRLVDAENILKFGSCRVISCRAIVILCTSSGPSAIRIDRTVANISARGKN